MHCTLVQCHEDFPCLGVCSPGFFIVVKKKIIHFSELSSMLVSHFKIGQHIPICAMIYFFLFTGEICINCLFLGFLDII